MSLWLFPSHSEPHKSTPEPSLTNFSLQLPLPSLGQEAEDFRGTSGSLLLREPTQTLLSTTLCSADGRIHLDGEFCVGVSCSLCQDPVDSVSAN